MTAPVSDTGSPVVTRTWKHGTVVHACRSGWLEERGQSVLRIQGCTAGRPRAGAGGPLLFSGLRGPPGCGLPDSTQVPLHPTSLPCPQVFSKLLSYHE